MSEQDHGGLTENDAPDQGKPAEQTAPDQAEPTEHRARPGESKGTASDEAEPTEPDVSDEAEPTEHDVSDHVEPTEHDARGEGEATERGGRGQGEFAGVNGWVRWRSWLPDTPAGAVVVVVHGVAEHSGRYDHLGATLAAAGYAVYAADHHGHGLSEGGRANIGRMADLAADLDQMLTLASQLTPGRPRFLIGHSMGSLVTLYLTTSTPVNLAGVVVSAPPLILPPVNPVLRRLAPLLSRIAPNTGTIKLDSLAISRDMAVVRDYDTDPLNFRGKLPVRTGLEIIDAAAAVRQRLSSFTYPLLVLHGSADQISDPGAVDIIKASVRSPDLTVKVYDRLYHEVFNEPERDQVIGDVIGWLDAHLGSV